MFGAINGHIHILLYSFSHLEYTKKQIYQIYREPTINLYNIAIFVSYFTRILQQGDHDTKFVDFLLNLFRWQADKETKYVL